MLAAVVLALAAFGGGGQGGEAGPDPRWLTDREDIGVQDGGRACRFSRLPQLALIDHPRDGRHGEFLVRAGERAAIADNEFRVLAFPDGRRQARIVVSKPAHTRAPVTAAVLVVGDHRIALVPRQATDPRAPGVPGAVVTIEDLPAEALDALARATRARLVLSTTQGEASRWTYDVSRLRYLRPAMDASGWSCPGW